MKVFLIDFKLMFNECKGKKNNKCIILGNIVDKENFDENFPEKLSRRMILSLVSKLYDPIGLVTPVSLKCKLLMRQLVMGDENIKWDDAVPSDIYDSAKLLFKELLTLKEIRFDRCLKPRCTHSNPILIIFCDGSMKGFGACAYVRWMKADGSYECNLIAAKGKICPLKTLTIPRVELCGCVVACRLLIALLAEMRYSFCKVVLP